MTDGVVDTENPEDAEVEGVGVPDGENDWHSIPRPTPAMPPLELNPK